jgi:hypothetical protein
VKRIALFQLPEKRQNKGKPSLANRVDGPEHDSQQQCGLLALRPMEQRQPSEQQHASRAHNAALAVALRRPSEAEPPNRPSGEAYESRSRGKLIQPCLFTMARLAHYQLQMLTQSSHRMMDSVLPTSRIQKARSREGAILR